MKRLKLKFLFCFALTIFLLVISFMPLLQTFGQSVGNVNDVIRDLENTAKDARIIPAADKAPPTIYEIMGRFINLFLAFLGVVFLIIIIYAGFIWMFAKGNQQEVDKAHKLLENSFIGICIILAAYLLTNFVVFRILGITLTQ